MGRRDINTASNNVRVAPKSKSTGASSVKGKGSVTQLKSKDDTDPLLKIMSATDASNTKVQTEQIGPKKESVIIQKMAGANIKTFKSAAIVIASSVVPTLLSAAIPMILLYVRGNKMDQDSKVDDIFNTFFKNNLGANTSYDKGHYSNMVRAQHAQGNQYML